MDWVSDPDAWLGLFILFGLPIWAILAKSYQKIGLSWRAFLIACGLFWTMGVSLAILDFAGWLPPAGREFLDGFYPYKNGNGRPLDRKGAEYYMRLTNGDRDKARERARADGWTF
jgi:hypothetical protein